MPDGAAGLRRTPCVGICSTTYGDLVCRGCKRFAHEIVAWNGFDNRQRDIIRARLLRLLGESVRAHVRVMDEARLRDAAREAGVADDAPVAALAFDTARQSALPLRDLGLASMDGAARNGGEAARAIDREFYLRSQAHYEASFKTLV